MHSMHFLGIFLKRDWTPMSLNNTFLSPFFFFLVDKILIGYHLTDTDFLSRLESSNGQGFESFSRKTNGMKYKDPDQLQ